MAARHQMGCPRMGGVACQPSLAVPDRDLPPLPANSQLRLPVEALEKGKAAEAAAARKLAGACNACGVPNAQLRCPCGAALYCRSVLLHRGVARLDFFVCLTF